MTEPWDIPPSPAYGDAASEVTHIARSCAIDAWEYVELSLFMLDGIFTMNNKTKDKYGSGKIF